MTGSSGHVATGDYLKHVDAGNPFVITPDNLSPLPHVARAIIVGTAGALHILTADNVEVTIPDGVLAANQQYVMHIRKVFDNGTTAANIIGFRE